MNLDVSSEFLVLAATLLQIKSSMLLPKYEEETQEEDPREELVRRLLEYKKYKESSKFLQERENMGNLSFYKEPDEIERPEGHFDLKRLTPQNLFKFYKQAFSKLERRRPPPKTSFHGIVGHEKVSVREKVKMIWQKLLHSSKLLFLDIFSGTKSRPEAVASFLAILELIKLKKIRVEYNTEKKLTVYSIDNNNEFYLDGVDEQDGFEEDRRSD